MADGASPEPESQESALMRVTAVVAGLWQLLLGYQVYVYRDAFRHPLLPMLVWCGMLATGAWLVPRVFVRREGLTRRESAVAVAVAVLAVAVVGWLRRPSDFLWSLDWSAFGVGWLLFLVSISRPPRAWISALLLVLAVHAVMFFDTIGLTRLTMTRFCSTTYGLALILIVFTMLRPYFRAQAALAADRAEIERRAAAERAVAAAARSDRMDRRAILEQEILPLLRDVADGTVSRADERVHQMCVRYASTLRRALTDREQPEGSLAALLDPVVGEARHCGVPLDIQVLGDTGAVPAPVAEATAAAAREVIRRLGPYPALFTVLASGDEIEVFLRFDGPLETRPNVIEHQRLVPADIAWCAMIDAYDGGGGCLEVRWPKVAPI